MARVNAASDLVRAGSLQGLARALAHPTHLRMAEFEHGIRRLVPLLVGVFLVILAVGASLQVGQSREHTFQDAIADMEFVGSMAALQIDKGLLHTDPSQSPAALLRALPQHFFSAGRQILVSDADGDIVAANPPVGPDRISLADRLGPAQPLTVFGEKAGVLRITLQDGTDAFATVRTLQPPLGQLAVIHPVAGLLEDWWTGVLRAGVVLGATAVALMAIATAYLWQSRRAHAAERHYGKVHSRIDTALNRGRCGLWDWDLARGRIYWSESMYAMLGMQATSEFVSFGDVQALVHPLDDDLSTFAESLAASELQVIDHVFRLRNVAGEWVWLRVRAELVHEAGTNDPYLVGIAVDITDEKRFAERSATADRRLSDAVEAISECFALWDENNELVLCNAKYLKLHRMDGVQFPVGYRPPEPVPAPAAPQGSWQNVPAATLAAAGAARGYELQLVDKRWLQVSERRTKDGGIVSVGTDITALKQHEERLTESEQRLKVTVNDLRRSRHALELQAQELAEMAERHLEKKAEAEGANRAKSEFLARMSHELRTPLNAILGFSDLMCRETFGPLGSDKYAGYAQDIRASGESLLGLITDVLEMAQLESGRVRLCLSLFPVEDTIDAVVKATQPQVAAKRLRLTADTPAGCVLHADRAAVEKVLQTIIANACKFTADGDAISVRARNANGGVNIFVADSGPGIAPDALARLGRPVRAVWLGSAQRHAGVGPRPRHRALHGRVARGNASAKVASRRRHRGDDPLPRAGRGFAPGVAARARETAGLTGQPPDCAEALKPRLDSFFRAADSAQRKDRGFRRLTPKAKIGPPRPPLDSGSGSAPGPTASFMQQSHLASRCPDFIA